jgi:hypothetical protein
VGCGLDSTVSGRGPVAGCCECGDEPSGSCATELVRDNRKEDTGKPRIPDLGKLHHHHHHHHHHHVAVKELGRMLARSCLSHPEVSSVVFLGSFCLLGFSFYIRPSYSCETYQ